MNSKRRFGCLLMLLLLLLLVAACEDKGDQGTARENHIVLKGEDNMRDLGGFEGADGRTVVYGKLFRSGELSRLTFTDLNVLDELHLAHVIDLRTDKERTKSPDKLPDGPEIHHLPLVENMSDYIDIEEKGLEPIILNTMTSLYSTIDSLKIQNWTAIFDILETGETTLWHCTEGKDRAGMTAALVLLSLGVDKKDVMDDFMMSNVYLAQSIDKKIELVEGIFGEGTGEILRPILGVEEDFMTAFFKTIDEDYGGIDAFLALLDVDIDAMREHYLEAPARQPEWPEWRHGL